MKLRHVRAVAVAVAVLVVLTGARKSDGGGCGNDNNNNHSSSSGGNSSGGHQQNGDRPAGSDIRLLDCAFQAPGGRTMVAELEVRNGGNSSYTYQAKVSFGSADAAGQELGRGTLVGFTVPAGETRTTEVTATHSGSGAGQPDPLRCSVTGATKRR